MTSILYVLGMTFLILALPVAAASGLAGATLAIMGTLFFIGASIRDAIEMAQDELAKKSSS